MSSININRNSYSRKKVPQSLLMTPDHSPGLNSNPFKFQSSLPTPAPSSPASPPSSYSPGSTLEVVDELVPNLTSSDVEFAQVELPRTELSLREVRSRLVKEFPHLVSTPEPAQKPRKPNAPPPALVPRSVSPSIEEKDAREKSLVLNLEREEERSVIKALVVLESRKGYFKKTGLAPDGSQANDLPIVPSPWLLPLDSSSLLAEGKRKNKKTFELPDLKTNTLCEFCSGSRTVSCSSCGSIEADECFWCDGTGSRKIDGKVCKVCQGNSHYQCSACKNSGKVECKDCNSDGVIEMSYFVDVVLRSIELPAIPVAMLFDEESGPPTSGAVRSMAVEKVLQATRKLCHEKSTAGTPVAAVVARCVWERSLLRTYSVFKPLKSKWKSLGEDSLSETGELHADTVFSGLSDSTEVGTHYFTISTDPQTAPTEVTSRSRAGSRVNSRANSRANSPVRGLSPRTSVADLRSALKASASCPNDLYPGSVGRKSSGGLLPSSTTAPANLGNSTDSSPVIKPRKSLSSLFSRSNSRVNDLSTSSSPFKSHTRSKSQTYELQSSFSKPNLNHSTPPTHPAFTQVVHDEIPDLPPRIETPIFPRLASS